MYTRHAILIMRLLAVSATLHVAAAPAAAQSDPAVTPVSAVASRPWARGVSEERQRRALELYEAGTEALKNRQFAAAEARYREALGHWDHPSIHYHLAIVLINLERPIEAYRNLLASLRYGGAALHAHERAQALQHKIVLQQRLARLDVISAEPGSVVLVDGARVLTDAGRDTRVVLAGEHQVVVRKRGHVTWADSIELRPSTRLAVEVHGRREMVARWIPWAVVGAGAAVGGLGAVLHWRADVDMERFDSAVTQRCANGCDDAPVWLMERAYREQDTAIIAYAAGTGMIVGGLVLAWINPERSFRLEQRRAPWQSSLVPLVSRTSTGIRLDMSF
jgi:hypothetical protein